MPTNNVFFFYKWTRSFRRETVVAVNMYAMYGYVGLCRAMYGYLWLCRAKYGYVGLCRAV